MKLLKIIKARLRKESKEDFVKQRINICLCCEKNTRNLVKLGFKQKFLRFLSDTLDFIMFSKRKDYGICNVCSCPIAYLTEDPLETCGEEKLGNESKWKSIYIPNKK